MDIAKLLDHARIACKVESDAALARCLGVTRAALSNWRTGQRFPDWTACASIANKTGLPLATVLAVVSAARSGDSGSQGGAGGPDPAQDLLPFMRASALG